MFTCAKNQNIEQPKPPQRPIALEYPQTKQGQAVDNYHGTEVKAPYRWLEDPDTSETKAWIESQNALTDSYFETLPFRAQIHSKMSKKWNVPKIGLPFKKGGRYFYSKNDGVQPQSVLYWSEQIENDGKVLLDPNTLSEDGTVALSSYSVSHDGKKLAYGLQKAGSDWIEWHVLEIDKGVVANDVLKWSKFSGATWTHDNMGFYYSKYPTPTSDASLTEANFNQKLYYHRLGTDQDKDELIYENPKEPKWGFGSALTEDGKHLLVSVWKGTGEKTYVLAKDITNKKSSFIPLNKPFESALQMIGSKGDRVWFFSDKDSPKGQIVAFDIPKNKAATIKEQTIVPEAAETISSANIVGGRLIVNTMKDAKSEVKIYETNGTFIKTMDLPGIGTLRGFGGLFDDSETFFSFESFTTPSKNYRYDIKNDTHSVIAETKVEFDSDAFETKQVFVSSNDGTKVPMFITHKKGIELNGKNPTLLYGYGGFNISLTPGFSITRAIWLEMGGVYVVANLRGGGEYGEEWHKAGTKLNKQNVFDDFIACAEWLIDNQYTAKNKLAIQGRSNGGLLVGAAITQRPDLFGAALPAVGVHDMLRFHKFTIGWAWVDDYGSSDNPEEFKALYAYSPLHNAKNAAYPATLITTADHDDRVVPGHSFKFAAALQNANAGPNPTLIRIDTKAGHGAGKPTQMIIKEYSDMWTFLAKNLEMKLPATF